MKNKVMAETAFIACLAVVLGYVELLIPNPIPLPGIKLGLSNLAVLFALYRLDFKNAWAVMLIKITLSAFLFNGFQTFWYSVSGGVLSLWGVILVKRLNLFSVHGVSITGGILHNMGQLFAASLFLRSLTVFFYTPLLIISGTVTGLLIGVICRLLLKYIPAELGG